MIPIKLNSHWVNYSSFTSGQSRYLLTFVNYFSLSTRVIPGQYKIDNLLCII